MGKVLDYAVVMFWLVSMTLLVARDGVPRWFAQDPPPAATRAWLAQQGRRFQYGIFDENGVFRGNGWTFYNVNDESLIRNDYLRLENLGPLDSIFLRSELVFLHENELDTVEIAVRGLRTPIQLNGERQGPHFAFELKMGGYPVKGFVLDADAARTFGAVIKPFSSLEGLQVGQTWKVQMLDPFALVQGRSAQLSSELVAVVGQERIRVQGTEYLCYVVESPSARAWVEPGGRVLRQQVQVPGLGRLEIVEQAFDQNALDKILKRGRRGRSDRQRHH